MSEEERQQIERVKEFVNYFYSRNINYDKVDIQEIYDIEGVLQIIEKQQKEIEIHKTNFETLSADITQVLKDLGISEETIIADEMVIEIKKKFDSKDKIREYLEKRINDVKKAYDDLTEPYYIEGVGFNISYMTKREKEEFINKRSCLIVQKQTYKEILDKVEEII